MDLSKAFDLVDYLIFLSKLHYYGVRGIPYEWFKSYLSDRFQFTQYNNSSSDFAPVTHGVPQGSILGPLLFLIYINDLILSSNKFEYIMYADDTTLIYTQPKLNNVEDNVNNELRYISNWFKANKLLLNLKKTICVFHNNWRDMSTLDNISLAIDSNPVSKVNVNFLGIQIVTWNGMSTLIILNFKMYWYFVQTTISCTLFSSFHII